MRWRSGLHPGSRWGSLQRSPDPITRQRRGGGKRGEGKGEGRRQEDGKEVGKVRGEGRRGKSTRGDEGRERERERGRVWPQSVCFMSFTEASLIVFAYFVFFFVFCLLVGLYLVVKISASD